MSETLGVAAVTATAAVIAMGLHTLNENNKAEAEVEKEAIRAGMVQQVVYPKGSYPRTIWVRPPAQPLVEQ